MAPCAGVKGCEGSRGTRSKCLILGHAKITERAEAGELLEAVRDEGENTLVERVYEIHVEAFDWNCPQHVTPRFTVDEIRTILAPFEERLQALEAENARLRTQFAAKG